MKRISSLLFTGSLCLAMLFVLPVGRTQAAPQQFKLEIRTLPSGFSAYNIGVAFADLISKNSSWLKAVHIEGGERRAGEHEDRHS